MSVGVFDQVGYVALRVRRKIGGTTRSRCWSLAGLSPAQVKALRVEAQALDEKWKAEQRAARFRRNVAATAEKGKRATAVRGVSLRERAPGAWFFRVQTSKLRGSRNFAISRLGFERAWREAIAALCQAHPELPRHELMKRRPPRPRRCV